MTTTAACEGGCFCMELAGLNESHSIPRHFRCLEPGGTEFK
jgi:hypothetical protein